ncbi:macrocin O-methyltransferase, partial [Mycobacterium sp. ITM-2017-0098]
MTDYDVRSLYLDLLRRNLTRYGMHERTPSDWPLHRRLLLKTVNTLTPRLRGTNARNQQARELGLDWPAEAETMIGMQRLTSLQQC